METSVEQTMAAITGGAIPPDAEKGAGPRPQSDPLVDPLDSPPPSWPLLPLCALLKYPATDYLCLQYMSVVIYKYLEFKEKE